MTAMVIGGSKSGIAGQDDWMNITQGMVEGYPIKFCVDGQGGQLFTVQISESIFKAQSLMMSGRAMTLEERLSLRHVNLIHPSSVYRVTTTSTGVALKNGGGDAWQCDFQGGLISLETLVSERLSTRRLFPESDLIRLASGMLSMLSFFEHHGVTHGDIHPSTVYFHPTREEFVVYDRDLLCGRCVGMRLAFAGEKFSYLSPEQIALLRSGSTVFTNNEMVAKSDLFSLGMTLLDAATLALSSECYDDNYSLVMDTVQQKLRLASNIYSSQLIECIAQLLESDWRKRPSPDQLYRTLQVEQVQAAQSPTPSPRFVEIENTCVDNDSLEEEEEDGIAEIKHIPTNFPRKPLLSLPLSKLNTEEKQQSHLVQPYERHGRSISQLTPSSVQYRSSVFESTHTGSSSPTFIRMLGPSGQKQLIQSPKQNAISSSASRNRQFSNISQQSSLLNNQESSGQSFPMLVVEKPRQTFIQLLQKPSEQLQKLSDSVVLPFCQQRTSSNSNTQPRVSILMGQRQQQHSTPTRIRQASGSRSGVFEGMSAFTNSVQLPPNVQVKAWESCSPSPSRTSNLQQGGKQQYILTSSSTTMHSIPQSKQPVVIRAAATAAASAAVAQASLSAAFAVTNAATKEAEKSAASVAATVATATSAPAAQEFASNIESKSYSPHTQIQMKKLKSDSKLLGSFHHQQESSDYSSIRQFSLPPPPNGERERLPHSMLSSTQIRTASSQNLQEKPPLQYLNGSFHSSSGGDSMLMTLTNNQQHPAYTLPVACSTMSTVNAAERSCQTEKKEIIGRNAMTVMQRQYSPSNNSNLRNQQFGYSTVTPSPKTTTAGLPDSKKILAQVEQLDAAWSQCLASCEAARKSQVVTPSLSTSLSQVPPLTTVVPRMTKSIMTTSSVSSNSVYNNNIPSILIDRPALLMTMDRSSEEVEGGYDDDSFVEEYEQFQGKVRENETATQQKKKIETNNILLPFTEIDNLNDRVKQIIARSQAVRKLYQ